MISCFPPSFLLLCALTSNGQPSILTRTDGDVLPLKLELEVLGKKYCAGDDEIGSLIMRCLLRFRNVGARPLILYRGRGTGGVVKIVAARSEADLRAKRFEISDLQTNVTTYAPWKVRISDGGQPGPDFLIIPVDGSYLGEETVALIFKRLNKELPALDPGDHFVQVTVETWPEAESLDLGRALNRRWKRWGDLWFQPYITSEPVKITIDRNPRIQSCE